MEKKPLKWYVTGVVIVLILVNGIVLLTNKLESNLVMIFSTGFLLGMLGMYIAVHLYKWK